MMEFAALTYGLLASILLTSAQSNIKRRRPHPPLLLCIGYLLCGLSAGLTIALTYVAVSTLTSG